MSIAQTFTVTVVSTDSGNKYVIDGVQQDTVMIGAGLTYKFDQSDSSNSTHPLRFATSEDAGGGSQYTTGVTAVGTPGSSGAYTEISVLSGAPSTLYYYCTNHGGMGGQANTDGWGRSHYGQMDWGDSNVVQTGWGRLGWGTQQWGEAPGVTLSGQLATSAVGEITVTQRPGWGTLDWGENGWGTVESAAVNLTAPSAMTSSVGAITPADVVGLTGQGLTSNVGAPTIILSPIVSLTGQAATSEIGTPSPIAGEIVGLTGQVATSAVGAITPDSLSLGITGVGATTDVGSIVIDSIDLINITGVGATSAVGSLTIEMAYELTGQSATSAVGTIVPADVVGLTGVEATTAVGNVSTLGYKDIDITGNTSYTDVNVA